MGKITIRTEDFIGNEFTTSKGATLKVIDTVELISGRRKFICVCSICSEDEELWPYGRITISKSELQKGSSPCGCAFNPKWDKNQYTIMIKRRCNKEGYKFLGFCDHPSVSSETFIKLFNPSTGNNWDTTTVSSFLNGGVKDPELSKMTLRNRRLINDDEHIKIFIKAGFTENHRFWRSDRLDTRGHKPYWNYTCPVCSNDEYVKAGVCSGVFEATTMHLKEGKISCRCTWRYRWTQEQREYQINKVCKEECLTFLGWIDEFKNNNSKFKWLCPIDHSCETSVSNFINRKTRCHSCSKEANEGVANGFYPSRIEEDDYLYCVIFTKGYYIKVGRSFDVFNRMYGLSYTSGHNLEDIKVISVYRGSHGEVYRTEQDIHKNLTSLGYYHTESAWSTETFKTSCFTDLKNLLSESTLEEVSLDQLSQKEKE